VKEKYRTELVKIFQSLAEEYNLPPRGLKGSAENVERRRIMPTILAKARLLFRLRHPRVKMPRI
jgi:hypothetical protein